MLLSPASLQVFELAEYEPLLREALALEKAGEPAVIRRKLRVLPNKVQGVAGGYSVEALFLLNLDSGAWEARLPKKTRVRVPGLALARNGEGAGGGGCVVEGLSGSLVPH